MLLSEFSRISVAIEIRGVFAPIFPKMLLAGITKYKYLRNPGIYYDWPYLLYNLGKIIGSFSEARFSTRIKPARFCVQAATGSGVTTETRE